MTTNQAKKYEPILRRVSVAYSRGTGLRLNNHELAMAATDMSDIVRGLRHAAKKTHKHTVECIECVNAGRWIEIANSTSTFRD